MRKKLPTKTVLIFIVCWKKGRIKALLYKKHYLAALLAIWEMPSEDEGHLDNLSALFQLDNFQLDI